MNLMTSTYLFLQPKPSEVQQGCITQGSPLDKSTVNIGPEGYRPTGRQARRHGG